MGNRKRNRQTKPDPNSNQSWLKWQKELDFQNPLIYQRIRYEQYYNHYYTWLQQIAYSIMEWEGFPEDVPTNYIEVNLHERGYLGYKENTKFGNVLVNGRGTHVGSYDYPTYFQSTDRYYKSISYPIYYYGRLQMPNSGFLIKNKIDYTLTTNDLSSCSLFRMYATRLAFLKTISDINLNTQKTPYILTYDDDLLLEEVQRLFTNVDGNMPVTITKAVTDEKGKKVLGGQISDMINVLDLKSPYLVDKLETQKQKEWDEAMACLGLMNTAQHKKERLTEQESKANIEQVKAMQIAMLKPREEFCHLYKLMTGKEITVKPRQAPIESEVGMYEFTTLDGNADGIRTTD